MLLLQGLLLQNCTDGRTTRVGANTAGEEQIKQTGSRTHTKTCTQAEDKTGEHRHIEEKNNGQMLSYIIHVSFQETSE